MELIVGIENLPADAGPSVVSIGNYDGVHRGHQQVIKTLLQQSQRLSATSTVITFEPLAKEFFRPGSVMRLTTIEQRADLLFKLGVQRVLCIHFTREFASLSPQQFVNDVLIDGLGVQYLCVGDDFRFGKDRAGDFAYLRQMGAEESFAVTAHDTFEMDGQRVSSGRVREALAAGDFALAEALLGRPYCLSGQVAKGQQLGRTIDYPTANIVLPEMVLPVSGVYIVQVSLAERQFNGVANIGTRPTVDGKENRLEVHIFDFDEDIYGREITVRFLEKIRDEQKFDSFASLKNQIELDASTAKARFAEKNTR